MSYIVNLGISLKTHTSISIAVPVVLLVMIIFMLKKMLQNLA